MVVENLYVESAVVCWDHVVVTKVTEKGYRGLGFRERDPCIRGLTASHQSRQLTGSQNLRLSRGAVAVRALTSRMRARGGPDQFAVTGEERQFKIQCA